MPDEATAAQQRDSDDVRRSSAGGAVVHLHHGHPLHTESEHPMPFDMGGLILARQAARRDVTSAQPGAPVRPDRRSRRSRSETLRRYSAPLLRRPGGDDVDPVRQ